MHAEASDTINSIKANACGAMEHCWIFMGKGPESQRLIYAGHELEDGRIMSDYNIEADSTLHLVLDSHEVRDPDDCEIHIVMLRGETNATLCNIYVPTDNPTFETMFNPDHFMEMMADVVSNDLSSHADTFVFDPASLFFVKNAESRTPLSSKTFYQMATCNFAGLGKVWCRSSSPITRVEAPLPTPA